MRPTAHVCEIRIPIVFAPTKRDLNLLPFHRCSDFQGGNAKKWTALIHPLITFLLCAGVFLSLSVNQFWGVLLSWKAWQIVIFSSHLLDTIVGYIDVRRDQVIATSAGSDFLARHLLI